MGWQEYEMDEACPADWLSWGALTHESAMRCKDGSFFGVLRHAPCPKGAAIAFPGLPNGWCLWSERQRRAGGAAQDFLAVAWNPFLGRGGEIINAHGKARLAEGEAQRHFVATLLAIGDAIARAMPCAPLRYQEILGFLSFSIGMGEAQAPAMPDPPTCLDALLTQDVGLDFTQRHLLIGGKELMAITLPALPGEEALAAIGEAIRGESYRHVRRLLLFSEKRAQKEQLWYTAGWCPGRDSLKELINGGILGEINGYHFEAIFLLCLSGEYAAKQERLRRALDALRIPWRFEEYRQKDIWWGSLAGMFRSGVAPPIVGLAGIADLLHRGGEAHVQDELVQEA